MTTFNLRFLFEADMNIEIEAENKSDAFEQLRNMTIADLINYGSVNNAEVSEEEVESIVDDGAVYSVIVDEINWDIDNEDDDVRIIALPVKKVMSVDVFVRGREIDDSDIEQEIMDELEYQYDFSVKSIKYKILEKK